MKSAFVLLTLWLLVVSSGSIGGEVYKWTDENGEIHYSDVPRDQYSEKLDVPETNIAEPVPIIDRPKNSPEKDTSRNDLPGYLQDRQPQLTERQQRLEEERDSEEKCQRYYGVSCKAVSHMLERGRPASGGEGRTIVPETPATSRIRAAGDGRPGR